VTAAAEFKGSFQPPSRYARLAIRVISIARRIHSPDMSIAFLCAIVGPGIVELVEVFGTE
jgi:hypothetical protein